MCNSSSRQLPRTEKVHMAQHGQFSDQVPLLSIIVPVYNDWAMLDGCLQSLTHETGIPFEVIIVDDGSKEAAPEYIRRWTECYPLTIVQQDHAGISAARNQGIRRSKGQVLVFVDADCRVQVNCLAALASTVANSLEHSFFQLHLVGDCSGAIGRAEELRLMTLQHYLLQPNGCIRYLNTAGFAVRRVKLGAAEGLFDPAASRAEDTLLLADLIAQRGELPLFVSQATVQHAIPLSLIGCLRKDIRSAYAEGRTYDIIGSKGVRIRMTNRERFGILWSTWKASRQDSIGRLAWFVLVLRQLLQRIISLIYWLLRGRTKSRGRAKSAREARL